MTDDTEEDLKPEVVETETETPQPQPQQAEAEAEAQPEVTEDEDEKDKRIARFARETREAKKLIRKLNAELEVVKGNRPPPPADEDLERRVEERATQKAQQEAFTKVANEIYDQGTKSFGKQQFDDVIKSLSEHTGSVIPPVIVEAVYDAGNPAAILKYLADEPDIYDELLTVPLHKMGARIAKIGSTLAAPSPVKVSKAPPPIKPVSSTSTSKDIDLENCSMAEYVKYMDRHDMKRKGLIS